MNGWLSVSQTWPGHLSVCGRRGEGSAFHRARARGLDPEGYGSSFKDFNQGGDMVHFVS